MFSNRPNVSNKWTGRSDQTATLVNTESSSASTAR